MSTLTKRPAVPLAAESGMRFRTLLVLLLVALAVRALYCYVVLSGYVPNSDAGDYFALATRVADGHGLTIAFPFGVLHPTAFRPPLYPLLLGAVFAVTGPSLGVAEAVNALLGAFVVVLIALLGGRLIGRRAGLVAGGLAAVYPPLLANDGPPLTEPLSLVLLLVILLALHGRRWALAGLVAGLLVLTRPSAQLLVPVLGIWVLVQAGWRRAGVVVVASLVVVMPWLLRNQGAYGTPVLVTSNGFNIAATWSPEAITAGRPIDPVYDPRFAAVRQAAGGNEARLDAAFRKAGLAGLGNNPGQVPRVLARNAVFLLDLSWRYGNKAEALDGRNLELRHAALPLLWAVETLGVVGLWRLRSQRSGPLLLVCAGYFLLVSVVAVSPPRLRAPLDVLTLLGTGAVVAAGRARLSGRSSGAA